MRPTLLAPLLALLSLAACALGSGIRPVGPGVYALTEMRAPVRGGGVEARRAVLAEAAGFCAQAGGHMSVIQLQPDGDPRLPEPTAFDLLFRCG